MYTIRSSARHARARIHYAQVEERIELIGGAGRALKARRCFLRKCTPHCARAHFDRYSQQCITPESKGETRAGRIYRIAISHVKE